MALGGNDADETFRHFLPPQTSNGSFFLQISAFIRITCYVCQGILIFALCVETLSLHLCLCVQSKLPAVPLPTAPAHLHSVCLTSYRH